MPSGVPLQLPWHRSHAMVFADQHRTPGAQAAVAKVRSDLLDRRFISCHCSRPAGMCSNDYEVIQGASTTLRASHDVMLYLPWLSLALLGSRDSLTLARCCSTGSHFGACPRLALVTTLQYFRESLGVHFKAGFETEFYLLQPEHRAGQELALHPVDASLYCQTSSFDAVASGMCLGNQSTYGTCKVSSIV